MATAAAMAAGASRVGEGRKRGEPPQPARRGALRSACAALLVALLAAGVLLVPMLRRLWRVPQVLVPQEEKDVGALRVGILGAATIAKFAVAYAAGKRRDISVVAVASRDPERAATFSRRLEIPTSLGGPQAYFELLRREDVDAVYICLPTNLHYYWASAALTAGKHVLLEKPAAMNAEEAARLQDTAKHTGKVLMEAAHHQHHPALLRGREIVRREIGRLWSLEARFDMVDPKAWATSTFSSYVHMPQGQGLMAWFWYLISPEKPLKETLQEGEAQRSQRRMKNLDRWWYCADALLWMTHATGWKVLGAREDNFGITAKLKLTMPRQDIAAVDEQEKEQEVTAKIFMSRDRFLPPFDWSIKASGSLNRTVIRNIGFPFIYHSIDVEPPDSSKDAADSAATKREQQYGNGESTWEHQLGAFVAAVRRGEAASSLERTVATMRLVDDILGAAGGGPLPSQNATAETKSEQQASKDAKSRAKR